MPVPDFEHKVQQQLKELKLPPSDVVWNQLEMSLRKRRRRRLIVFLLFFGLLISGAGFLHESQLFSGKTVSIKQNLYSNDTTDKHSQHSRISDGLSQSSGPDSGGRNHLIVPKLSDTNSGGKESSGMFLQSERERQPLTAIRKNGWAAKGKRYADVSPTKTDNRNPSFLEEIHSKAVSGFDETVFIEKGHLFPPKTQLFDIAHPAVDRQILASTAVSAAVMPLPRNNRRTWQWGLQAGAGVSTLVSEGLLNIWEKTTLNDAYGISSNLAGNFLPPPASRVRPGLSWSTGIWVRRNLTRKWAVEAGLNYLEQSTIIQVGSYIDSLSYGSPSRVFTLQSSGLYRNGSGSDYVNRHRFLELPLQVSYTIRPTAPHPISVNGGIALSKLIQTNALHYDQGTAVYFQDVDLFQKMQWSMHAGVSLPVGTLFKHPIDLGGRFRYANTPLYKRQQSSSRHLLSAGVELKWYLR